MIVYVSPAEFNGGILQFSVSIARETMALMDCRLFLPNSVDISLYRDIGDNVVPYIKSKTLNYCSDKIRCVAEQIMQYSPDIVIFTEDSILMQQINMILNKKNTRTAMVVHDVKHHPYRKMGVRRVLVDVFRRLMIRKTIEHCCKIILLSANSENLFRNEYRAKNTVVFRLPAHVPESLPKKPLEISEKTKKYILFFGRIDKYKGIGNLCRAYSTLDINFKEKIGLIIAGKGQLSQEEMKLIQTECYITPINRFITDSEMVWLFQNAVSVVMPYTEASQSGVLPIAYKFGKPVVVSDLRGLTENVIEKKTGYVFKTGDELSKILYYFDSSDFLVSEDDIIKYYHENFSWKNNLETLFRLLLCENRDE